MARKKKPEEHENHERWLVSYADFITLLFAFFVVMYSVSSVNEGKYRVLSQSLSAAFRAPTKSLAPIQLGSLVRSPHDLSTELQQTPAPMKSSPINLNPNSLNTAQSPQNNDFIIEKARRQVDAIAAEVEDSLANLIEQELVDVRRNKFWLEVEIKSKVLFDSGSSKLGAHALPVLKRLGHILAEFPNRIQVEGFTGRAWLFSPVQGGDRLYCGWQGGQEMFD